LVKRAVGIGLVATILAVAVVGAWLLRDMSRGSPVAAAFTRVGGPTRVETAVDASRFWVKPPKRVVTTPAGAGPAIMLAAARCAMAHDAPLLFTSRNPRRQRLVETTIDNWQTEATAAGLPIPEVTKIRNQHDVNGCPTTQDPAGSRVSTLNASNWLLQQSHQLVLPVEPADTLASVVVFAVAREPGYPPDVAVGLALAAHMATAHQHISVVVLPRYIEAYPTLEDQLRSQRQLVTDGVVLGSARILSEDTRALLRQILTSPDQLGVLGQIQNTLELAGTRSAGVKPDAGALKDWIDTVGSLITSIAIVVGGIWAYFKFVKGRTFRPRIEITMSARWQKIRRRHWLLICIRVKNIGASKVTIQQAGTGLRVSVLAQQQRPPPVRASWDSRGMYSIFKDHSWIEPGETVSDDLLLNLGVGPAPVLLEGYLILPRRVFGDTETSAREVIPVDAVLSPPRGKEDYPDE